MQPIVTPSEMAAIDAAAPEPVEDLIERAGWAVARVALEMLGGGYGRRVVVVAGKGNNGNDGRSAARFLSARGARCRVVDPDGNGPGYGRDEVDLVIDAAFGTGFRGEFHFPDVAAHGTRVLAVDVPSGVDGTTGVASGRPAPAQRTVTFAAWKPGLLLADGADLAGEVTVVDIGLDTARTRAHLITDEDLGRWAPRRPRAAHKWQSAAWVIAGSPGMSGAARLAAGAAQRGGAGYVRLSTPGVQDPPGPVEAVSIGLPGDRWAASVVERSERVAAVAVGPGLGTRTEVAAEVRNVVAGLTQPTVVDGDGLRALGRSAAEVIGARGEASAPVVLTPHDGEYEALTGSAPGPDRFEAVRRAARATGAVVLLKGPTTLVAHPDGSVLAVNSGDRRLATAGTGDVLTGLCVALLAQGVAPFPAAAAAAHLHGRAGDLACPRGLVAGDLLDHLPAVLTEAFGA